MRKEEELKRLENFTTNSLEKIASSKLEYKSFLIFQSKLYKYRFEDSILIYAQNPNAQACANYDQWNKIGRRIHRGKKAMRLFNENDNEPLKCVFDLKDTYGKEFKYPIQIAIDTKYENQVVKSFGYGISHDTFSKNFKACVEEYVLEKYSDYVESFLDSKIYGENDRPILEDTEFIKAVCNSVGYIACERYKVNKGIYDTDEAFSYIDKIDNKRTLMMLGGLTQRISQDIVLHIQNSLKIAQAQLKQTQAIEENTRQALEKQRQQNLNQQTLKVQEGIKEKQVKLKYVVPPIVAYGIAKSNLENHFEENKKETQEKKYEDDTGPKTEIKQNDVTNQEAWEEKADTLNFVINSENDISQKSGKSKYNDNINALELLKKLENDNRNATAQEQKILAKFSGFGGIPQAFDAKNADWTKEYEQLKTLVSKDEYEALKKSTLNAHYTSPDVINAIYKALEQMGFEGGNVLEPACGDGRFFGMLPKELTDKTNLYGIELDILTGRIAKQLYPNASIEINGFENTKYSDNFFDVAIGNVPFGAYSVNDRKFNKHNFFIHDYFFSKTLDKVKPNGVIAFVTSSGTMDKANSSARKYIAERAELLGAIRLPNDAFKQSANTKVTTDILFLQKRETRVDASEIDWVYTGNYKNIDKEVMPLNQYYIDNPHMMLGEMKYDKSMYGNDKLTALHSFQKPKELSIQEETEMKFEKIRGLFDNINSPQSYFLNVIKEHYQEHKSLDNLENNEDISRYYSIEVVNQLLNGNLEEIRKIATTDITQVNKSEISFKTLLDEAINYLPKDKIRSTELSTHELEEINSMPASPDVKNLNFVLVENKVYQRENSILVDKNVPENQIDRIEKLIELRELTKEVLNSQAENCSDDTLYKLQNDLNEKYDIFIDKYGFINSKTNLKNFGDDGEFPILSSIEKPKDGTYEKGDIFSKRTISPFLKIEHVDKATEALTICLNDIGQVDIPYISNLCKKDDEQVIEDLQGLIFKNPLLDSMDGSFSIYSNWETADEYLSGEVVRKLEIAKEYSQGNPIYKQNVDALEQVQPVPIPAQDIDVRIGASWVDIKYYQRFMEETFTFSSYDTAKINYSDATNTWNITDKGVFSIEATKTFGTSRMSGIKLMEIMLNQQRPKIYDTRENADGKPTRELNKEETIAIKEKYNALNKKFKDWIFKDITRREELVAKYNRLFNSTRVRQYDGSFLRFEGMNPEIELRQHQKDAVARVLFGGNSLLAHVVGAGKSATRS